MGNSILYYEPKTTTSPTYLKAVTGKSGKPTYPAPGAFLKTNFKTTVNAPFGSMGALNSPIVVRRLDLIRAALECGYGRRNVWTASFAVGKKEAAGMRRYLYSRLEMALSCVEIDAKGTWRVLPFSEYLEASEKTALSFIFGGIGAYLAARAWLDGGGDALSLCLHVGIYAKGANPTLFFPVGTGSSPDFLVHTRANKWHVFESKGGGETGRYSRVVEGLAQLATMRPVCWIGDFPQTPTTSVCVHTSVDSGRNFSLVAYDPPADHGDEADDEDGRSLESENPVELIKGVCKLLLLLEALDQYKAMVGEEIVNEPVQQESWTFRKSDAFGGLIVGIPTCYLENERKVRERMAVYLSALETVHELRNGGVDLFRQTLVEKLKVLELSELSVEVSRYFEQWRADSRNTVLDAPHDFFPSLALLLQLNELSDELMIQPLKSMVSTLGDPGEEAITSGGLYIRIEPDPLSFLG